MKNLNIEEKNNLLKKNVKKYRCSYKIQLLTNIIIIILLILIIIIFKGPVKIPTQHNNLKYNLYINNNKIDKFKIEEQYKKILIPYLIYKTDYTSNEYTLHTNTYFTKENQYNLKLDISKCIKAKREIDCLDDYESTKKINYDTSKFNMTIKFKDDNKIVYHGKLIKDITKYLSQIGNYYFVIEGNINNIMIKIEFDINIFN